MVLFHQHLQRTEQASKKKQEEARRRRRSKQASKKKQEEEEEARSKKKGLNRESVDIFAEMMTSPTQDLVPVTDRSIDYFLLGFPPQTDLST
jgi:hypothetical protein